MGQQHVLGVHGIGQGKTSQRELTKSWRDAFDRGVKLLHGGATPMAEGMLAPVLKVPHWSALLVDDGGGLSTREAFPDEATPFTADEEAFIVQALDDVLTPQERAYAAQVDPTTLGLPKVPPSITRRAIAYDRRKPGGRASKLILSLREVHTYLTEPDLASLVRKHVLESADGHTTVLIGHSLGSVIAYDLLRHEEIAASGTACGAVHTLITCGSPLAIPTVQRGMGITDGRLTQIAPHLRWINVFDPDDAVTGAAGLALTTDQVRDVEVDNGRLDPHAAVKYLRTLPVARAVTDTWS
ncbi:endopeptidase [Streptomyces anthocyanicus]|uniref:endopeptidase n=1 Tax=Streptomyces anthocyanicus TaxID=68174 RepID=UPI0022446351|nr:endopeptidase [Streptomyces anthocyanicus]MCW8121871.1 GPI inositol-deacylase [Streptomyces anthocyanicus]